MSLSSIRKNIGYMTFVQFANYIVPLIMLPYLSRVIGVEGVGVISVSLSVCALAFIATDYGFVISSPAWISKNRDDRKAVSQYLTTVFLLKIFLVLFVLLFLSIYVFFSNSVFNGHKSILVAIFFTVVFQAYQIPWFFQGIEKMKNITFCTVTTKMTYLLFVVVFVSNIDDLNYAMYSFCLSNFLSCMLGIFLLYREGYYLKKPEKGQPFRVLKYNIPFFLSRLAVGVYTNASTFIIGSQSGLHQAAIYSSAEKLYQGAVSLSSPVSQALYPYLAKAQDVKVLIRFLFLFSPVMILGAVLSVLYAKEIVIVLYGVDFVEAEKILKIFVVISVISFFSINFGYPAYSTINRLDIVNKSVIIGGGIQLFLLLVLYLLDNINAKNVVTSILFVEVFIMTFRVFVFFKISKSIKGKK